MMADYSALFDQAGKKFNVDPKLIAAVIQNESGGNPNAVSPQGAEGLGQLMPATAKAVGVTDPKDPKQNIFGTAQVLAQNLDHYGNVDDAIRAYHGGWDQQNWGPKTEAYHAKVSSTYGSEKPVSDAGQDVYSLWGVTPGASKALQSTSSAPSSSVAATPDAYAFWGAKSDAPAKPQGRQPQPLKGGFGFKEELTSSLPFGKDAGAAGEAVGRYLTGNAPDLATGYREGLQDINAAQAKYESENPGSSIGANLLGIFASARPSPSLLANGLTRLQTIGHGALAGAGFGAAQGAGTAGADLETRGKNALTGGAIGGTLGAAIPAAGIAVGGIGSTVGKVANALSEKFGLKASDATEQAQNLLMRAFSNDSIPVSGAAADIAAAGAKPTTLMDVGGSNVQRLARNLTVQPGAAGEKIADVLSNRAENQSGRVLNDIKSHLSNNTDVYGLGDSLSQARSVAAAPLYKDAFSQAPVITDRLKEFAAAPEVQKGMKEGITLARREALAKGEKFDPNAYAITGFNEAGDPEIGAVPTWRTWDAAKQGLDEIIEANRDPVTRQLPDNKTVNSLRAVKNSLVSELDKLNPAYKSAREAWSGPSQSKSAIGMGEGFLKADPEEIATAFKNLSPGDQDFYRIGAARALQDKVNSAADSADLTKRLFGNNRVRSQIETVFGKGSADKFAQAMGQESRMAQTNRAVLGGSNTANKLADMADVSGHHEAAQDFVHGALGAAPLGPHMAVAGGVYHATTNAARRTINKLFNGMDPKVANELSDYLTASGQDAVDKLNHLLTSQGSKQAAQQALSANRRNKLFAASRLLSGLPGEQYNRPNALLGNPQ